MPFAVLFVCTGNICRSPVAERLFLARLKDSARGQVGAASAGTHAVVGHGIDGPSATVLEQLGGDPHGHRAQQIDDDLVRGADLILTASSSHRATILGVEPAAMRRTFTLREFARLSRELPPRRPSPADDPLRRRVAEVAACRGGGGSDGPGGDDIADPFGGTVGQAQLAVEQVSAAVDAALDALGLRAAAG